MYLSSSLREPERVIRRFPKRRTSSTTHTCRQVRTKVLQHPEEVLARRYIDWANRHSITRPSFRMPVRCSLRPNPVMFTRRTSSTFQTAPSLSICHKMNKIISMCSWMEARWDWIRGLAPGRTRWSAWSNTCRPTSNHLASLFNARRSKEIDRKAMRRRDD